jgi:hypothetical protein
MKEKLMFKVCIYTSYFQLQLVISYFDIQYSASLIQIEFGNGPAPPGKPRCSEFLAKKQSATAYVSGSNEAIAGKMSQSISAG